MNFSPLKNFRILLWILFILGSVIAIHPTYSGGFDSNLQFGIDIEGGSWIDLELEGNLIQVDGARDPIVEYLIESRIGADLTIIETTDTAVTFSLEDLATYKDAIDNAVTWGTLTFDDDAGTVAVEVEEITAQATLLKNVTNGSKVTLVSFEDEEWFEVRRSLTEEEESLANDLSEQAFEDYLVEWYSEQLGDLATVTKFLNRVSPETTRETRDIISTKLNYLGLSDIPVKTIENDRYISIEFAGKELGEAELLVTEQGKFEIKIVSEKNSTSQSTDLTVDILELMVTGDEIKNVDHYTNLNSTRRWEVPFTLTSDGAESFTEQVLAVGADSDPQGHYIVMLLDDQIVFDAPLSTDFADSISNGTWKGENLSATFGTQEEDMERARILWIQLNAGALPVKQRIIAKGYTSPALGSVFLQQIVLAGIGAILAVGIIVYLRYKTPKIVLPLLVAAFSETVIVLGVAALIKHQLDLSSIAGILATLGTGVDQMVIITDEVLRGEDEQTSKLRTSISKRVSRAFSIIFASATTTIVAMTPLAYMQLGVLRGFAIVTIIGILVGVFVTRPTYAKVINIILGKEVKAA
jgi:preprotein translocase subunit SecD